MPTRFASLAVVQLLIVFAMPATLPAADPTPPSTAEQLKGFNLPPGFEIQLVVSDPDIGQPMNLNFDARGRLWLTHSIEYPYPAKGEGVEPDRGRFAGGGENEPRDRLTIIELGDTELGDTELGDTGLADTGRAKTVTHFVTGLNIPIGNTPLKDGSEALVYAIPSIFHAVDKDGDGKSDSKATLYTRFGNRDVHGNASSFTRWIDGWIYGCHGFSNHSEVTDSSGRVVKLHSGNTYRFREDGSHFQQHTWGQVNPFGMTFDPLGNLYNSDCHSRPVYQMLRGATYPSFGSQPPAVGFGPEMINHNHGSTGICGPAYYAADHFPAEYRDNLFICNPVTGRVHRDKLKRFGSTYQCDSQPDFITTDDKWFRPVDAMVGPDGALYIADFCNLVIGHYEAPLNHPDRDRTHGRVWRVVYRGTGKTSPSLRPLPDLTKYSTLQLVEQLGNPNLLVRTLATNFLVDAHATTAPVAVLQALRPDSPAELRAHGLWVLERLGHLDNPLIEQLASDDSPLVRVHLMRALAERQSWTTPLFATVRKGLIDPDEFVRRAAADSLGMHPLAENVAPLLAAWKNAAKEDTHLIHTIRLSLLRHLNDEKTTARLLVQDFDQDDGGRLVEVAAGSKNQLTAALILRFAPNAVIDPAAMQLAIRQVAGNGSAADVERLISMLSSSKSHATAQLAALGGLSDALIQRGEQPSANSALKAWLKRLASKLLDDKPVESWTNSPLPEHPDSPSPWGLRQRTSTDGKSAVMIDSIVHGEQATGVYRSPKFTAPPKLSFWLCGHSGGQQSGNGPVVNHIRLRRLDTNEVVAQQNVPRNDTAQKVTWDLAKHAGRECVVELVDADTAAGFAWIAVGRFEPAVVSIPSDTSSPTISLLDLVGRFGLSEFAPRVLTMASGSQQDPATRVAAVTAVTRLLPKEQAQPVLSSLLADASSPTSLRIVAAQLLAADESPESRVTLTTSLKTAPAGLQREIALALAGSTAGLDALLTTIAEGKASALLLQEQRIAERLTTLGNAKIKLRAAELTKSLPPVEAKTSGLIRQRLRGFAKSDSSLERGLAVFKKNCAACHKLRDVGVMMGPQLDGIGLRGAERLLEDLLDPNRNVDAAFRTVNISTANGKVISGLIRRKEGAILVLADSKGQEVRVPLSDIDE
ncbi:MAG: putative heme-binding domain-containing protein, partial [Pirellulaceae bacterium]